MLLTVGITLLAFGDTAPVHAQDDGEGDYIGVRECASCHRTMVREHAETAHGLALQDVERDKDPILADFDQGEDLRTVTFPGDDEARAFDDDDIVYVIGTGKRVQAYLAEVDRREYMVLPAQWNVEEGVWEPLALAESWPDPAYDWAQNCAYCHVTNLDTERGRWDDDGVQCEACHGPGSEHAELAGDISGDSSDEELAAVRAAINPATDPQICGQCHGRGTDAENHPYPAGYVPGEDLSEVYTLSTPDDLAHWYPTGHARSAYMQYNEWLTTGHATSLSALLDYAAGAEGVAQVDDSCLTCHSSDYNYTESLIAAVAAGNRTGAAPDALTLETAHYPVGCTTCHDPHSQGELPDEVVQEAYPLCTNCHSTENFTGEGVHHPVKEMFEGIQVLPQVSSRPSDHFLNANGPDCQTCHLPEVPVDDFGSRVSHAFSPITPQAAMDVEGLTDSCSACHEEAVTPELLQKLIDDVQTDTRERIDMARAAVNAGTPTWVIDALDFVEGDGSLGIHNYAYADALLDAIFTELELFPASGQ
ncbi:MAG: hypothetical protein IT320_22510 [Anaerolineae bacterium]|nr:hypothetical protein [Anaerolineae bacterium]